VELLAAATERVNPIVSARAKAQELSLALLAQIRLASERSSLRQAGPGKLSGTVAKLRKAVPPAAECDAITSGSGCLVKKCFTSIC